MEADSHAIRECPDASSDGNNCRRRVAEHDRTQLQDRWAVIAYVRALQLSGLGSVDDLPPDQQAALKK